MYVDKTPRLPSPSGARRVSIYPSLIEEPILEDHEFEQDAEREEGVCDSVHTVLVAHAQI